MVASVMSNESDEQKSRSLNRLASAVKILVGFATVLTIVLMAWFVLRGR
jgi:hypothetical protein